MHKCVTPERTLATCGVSLYELPDGLKKGASAIGGRGHRQERERGAMSHGEVMISEVQGLTKSNFDVKISGYRKSPEGSVAISMAMIASDSQRLPLGLPL